MFELLVLLGCIVCYGNSLITETNLDPKLQKCFDDLKVKYHIGHAIGYNLYETCIIQHVTKLVQNSTQSFSREEQQYVSGLLNEIQTHDGRVKRQSSGRLRSEIRQLSPRQLRRYHSAVRRLKNQRSRRGRPNYDTIADIHAGVIPLAHNGPVFPGWHMVYLLVYEAALRRIDSSVTVPYYASVLDDAMERSERAQSVVWSPRFHGNCDGTVTRGPYRNFQTPNGPLMRQCGLFGAPYSYEGIERIFARRLNAEIFAPNAQFADSLESQHNDVHSWMGGGVGQVGRLDFAPYDPCFFHHHAYVDKLWYDFKVQQRDVHGTATHDYPPTTNSNHAPDARLGFGRLTNRDSYQDVTRFYSYTRVPTCSVNSPGDCEADSPFYTCNTQLPTPRCRSLSISEARGIGGGNRPRRKRQAGKAEFSNFSTHTDRVRLPRTLSKSCSKSEIERSMQNSFYLDGKVDSSNWVYIAVDVLYNRPPEMKTYESFPVKNGTAMKSFDIYSSHHNNHLRSELIMGKPMGYRKCENPSMNAELIFIGSNGLNYYGDYKEFVVGDKRMAMSSTTGYVAVKSPETGDTEAIIHAHDACGRICKAYCLIPGSSDMYRQCNGAIKLTNSAPKMYGKSIAECVDNMWKFSTTSGYCPRAVKSDVFLKFHCDYKEDWPWLSGGVHPLRPLPPSEFEPSTPSWLDPSTLSNPMDLKPSHPSGFDSSHSSGFKPSHSSGFDSSHSSGFKPSHSSGFDSSHSSGFKPSHSSGFESSRPSGFKPSHPSKFQPPSEFEQWGSSKNKPSNPSRYQPPHPTTFAPSHPSGYQPSHPSGSKPLNPSRHQPSLPSKYEQSYLLGSKPSQPSRYQPSLPSKYEQSHSLGLGSKHSQPSRYQPSLPSNYEQSHPIGSKPTTGYEPSHPIGSKPTNPRYQPSHDFGYQPTKSPAPRAYNPRSRFTYNNSPSIYQPARPECQLSSSCTIRRPCRDCTENEKVPCDQSKIKYAMCVRGKFYICRGNKFIFDSHINVCRSGRFRI